MNMTITFIAVATASVFIGSANGDQIASPQGSAERANGKPWQMAAACFLSGEQTSGMNKICYYDCMGSTVAITIGATALCPLSINR